MRNLYKQMIESTRAPTYRSHYHNVNILEDIERVAEILLEEEILLRKPNRYTIDPEGAQVEVTEAIVVQEIESKKIFNGKFLTKALKLRKLDEFPAVPRETRDNQEGWIVDQLSTQDGEAENYWDKEQK